MHPRPSCVTTRMSHPVTVRMFCHVTVSKSQPVTWCMSLKETDYLLLLIEVLTPPVTRYAVTPVSLDDQRLQSRAEARGFVNVGGSLPSFWSLDASRAPLGRLGGAQLRR